MLEAWAAARYGLVICDNRKFSKWGGSEVVTHPPHFQAKHVRSVISGRFASIRSLPTDESRVSVVRGPILRAAYITMFDFPVQELPLPETTEVRGDEPSTPEEGSMICGV